MGLDMYLFKVERLSGKEHKELHKARKDDVYKNYHCIDKEDFDRESDMYGDLKPYVRPITVITTFFNYEQCLKDYNINKDDILFRSQGNGTIGWHLTDNTEITLTEEQYSKYLYDEEQEVYVFKCEQAAYWRKYYDLADFFDTKHNVENCGYYLLSYDEKQELKEYLRKHDPDSFKNNLNIRLLNSTKANLFYHAWW